MSEPHAILGAATAIIAVVATATAVVHAGQRGQNPPAAPPPTASYVAFPSASSAVDGTVVHANEQRTLPTDAEASIVARARLEVERGVTYDASYRVLPSYPNGDVPADRGACTDLVVRAYRTVDVDLQRLVHEDVVAAPQQYDFSSDLGNANIDHRRVTTLFSYFERNALALGTDAKADAASFRPGDVVFYAWKRCYPGWPCVPEHVAIVSDRKGPRGLPLVLQNGGPVATEADVLDQPKMVGHFRLNNVFRSSRR